MAEKKTPQMSPGARRAMERKRAQQAPRAQAAPKAPRPEPAAPSAGSGGAAGRKPAGEAPRRAEPAAKAGPARSARPQAPAAEKTGAPRTTPGSTRVRDRARLSERIAPARRLQMFLASAVPDFLLVLVVATALAYTVSYAFNSAWDYRGNVGLIALMAAPVLACLYLGTWKRRLLGPSVAATAAVSVAIIAGAAALSPDGGQMVAEGGQLVTLYDHGVWYTDFVNDVPENYAIFAIVVVLCAVLSFLLSRRTALLVGLLAASVIACGVVQYLYRDWVTAQPGIPATLAVVLAVGMLFIYQTYKQSVYSSARLKRTSFPGAFLFSLLIAGFCVLVSAGVYYGVVAGLDLFTPDVRLYQEFKSPPEDPNGADYEAPHYEGDDTSDNADDDEESEGSDADGGEEGGGGGSGSIEQSLMAQAVAEAMGYDLNNLDDEQYRDLVVQTVVYTALIAALCVALAVLLAVLLQRSRRGLRLRMIAGRSRSYQAWRLYTFLTGRLRRLGVKCPPGQTPVEFARAHERALRPFTRGTGGVDFLDVTRVYEGAVFSDREPTEEDLEAVRGYYRAFFRNARIATSWPKWVFWRFWRM